MQKATLLNRWLGFAFSKPEPGSANWYFRRDKLALVCFFALVFLIFVAIAAPILTPYPEQGLGDPNISEKFLPPSLEHPFGTDDVGRDLLARVMYGARTSFIASFAIVIFAVVVGTLLGAIAGYFGGWIDEVIMRITDVFLAFPPLLLAITIASVLEPNLRNSVLAVGATWWPWYTRIVRAQALSIRERNYVKAARCMGVSDFAIVRRHILPNVLSPVLVQATLDLGSALLTMAGLSFLGLGVQPPTADWGVMVNDGRAQLQSGRWWIGLFPGLAIFISTLSFNLLGDGVQTATDPRVRSL
ncbi:MAG: ABC transporter permease [Chloroflexota bacterium]